jgi:cytoskeletal protein CcmA (bactofilin family)
MPSSTSQLSDRTQGLTTTSIISGELLITGNVTSKGAIHLDGKVRGDVHCLSLVLGESSQLEGSALAEDVVVSGRLVGSVRALRVTLQAKARVEGDLLHQSLVIELGAQFSGSSHPCEDPLQLASAARERGKNHSTSRCSARAAAKRAKAVVTTSAEPR